MKVIQYNAITLDGFIATKEGNSDWVLESGWPDFETAIKEAGCLIVGHRTFQQFEGETYPIPGVLNVVMSRSTQGQEASEELIFTGKSPADILDLLESKGYSEVVLIGGGTVNAAFLEAGLIDKLIVIVHPLVLGNGIRLYEASEVKYQMKLLSSETLADGTVKMVYMRS